MEPKGYLFHNNSPLVTILNHTNTVHTTPYYLYKIQLILSTHLHIGLPSGLFPSGFPTNNLYSLLPIHATCPGNLILLDLIILIIHNKEYGL
jgi:hypothetical protein